MSQVWNHFPHQILRAWPVAWQRDTHTHFSPMCHGVCVSHTHTHTDTQTPLKHTHTLAPCTKTHVFMPSKALCKAIGPNLANTSELLAAPPAPPSLSLPPSRALSLALSLISSPPRESSRSLPGRDDEESKLRESERVHESLCVCVAWWLGIEAEIENEHYSVLY